MLKSSKISNGINGIVKIPSDKSISHRSVIIPSITKGITEVNNILMSEDVIKTIKALKLLGVEIIESGENILIKGKGLNSLIKSKSNIDLGNSGTSARLLTGLLSSQNFNTILTGDESLSKRPMERIMKPLKLMGAKFESNNGTLPIKIYGNELNNIKYELDLPSAQVKSGIILAALNTKGKTTIVEKNITRNHTEILLEYFEAAIDIQKKKNENIISITGKKELTAKNISVPSDLSSAAFFIVAALINKNSEIKINNVNLNNTREGIILALIMLGAKINITNSKWLNGEHVVDLKIKSSNLVGCELDKNMAKTMIDEYPILSIAASFAKTPSVFKGLGELKYKESNRLELIKYNLEQCGIFCKIEKNDLFIDPTKKINFKSNKIKTNYDHRIAMAFIVMGTRLGIDLFIDQPNSINTSFPKFFETLNKIGGKLSE